MICRIALTFVYARLMGNNGYMREHWNALTAQCDPTKANACFHELENRYGEPHRHYHTLSHVRNLLQLIDSHREHLLQPAVLAFAAWFHDAVYDTRRSDNELQSADLAQRMMNNLELENKIIKPVTEIILATSAHLTHSENDRSDLHYFLDMDLAVLGQSPQEYKSYAESICAEYIHVPAFLFRAGRKRILRSFLETPRLYHTTQFFSTCETRARENLSAELAGL